MAVKGKEFRYAVAVERDGRIGAEGLTPLATPEGWSPEHLLLAALVRCSLTSLRYHADRIDVDVVASGSATSRIAKRASDGRFAFQEIEVRLELEPEPPGEELPALLAKAQRDCFIGASLTVGTHYRWRVNGREVAAAL